MAAHLAVAEVLFGVGDLVRDFVELLRVLLLHLLQQCLILRPAQALADLNRENRIVLILSSERCRRAQIEKYYRIKLTQKIRLSYSRERTLQNVTNFANVFFYENAFVFKKMQQCLWALADLSCENPLVKDLARGMKEEKGGRGDGTGFCILCIFLRNSVSIINWHARVISYRYELTDLAS